jgi:hypothetical protein
MRWQRDVSPQRAVNLRTVPFTYCGRLVRPTRADCPGERTFEPIALGTVLKYDLGVSEYVAHMSLACWGD